jgi:predicted deacetylase
MSYVSRKTRHPVASDQTLCVSVHDVAPATWGQCRQLARAIREVAPLPLTFLVVPAWHHRCHEREEQVCVDALEVERASGSELALHGYTHLDEGRRPNCMATYFWRHIYTAGEAEFAGLSFRQARQRLAWGREWFARQGWPVEGFVAPAWLMSAGSWRALRRAGLRYTATFSRFYLLQEKRSLFAPSLFYGGGRLTSRFSQPLDSAAAWGLRQAPLLRLALQPRDARYPSTILHCQRLLEKLLVTREALTNAQFAQRWSELSQHDDALVARWAGDKPA